MKPTGELDGCASCGAPLIPDQRYCLTCGERRGKPRFSLPTGGASGGSGPASRIGERRSPRLSASGNFIAVVATLILAMGVGVLIGQGATASTPVRQAGVTAIFGGGAGGVAGAADASGATDSGGAANSMNNSSKKSKSASSKSVPKVNTTTIATPPASVAHGAQIAGHGATNLPPVTATQGQSCSAGTVGCQNGQLTGNFFGGG